MEADPRRAEIIVGMLGLKRSNSVTTPGVKEEPVGEMRSSGVRMPPDTEQSQPGEITWPRIGQT